MNVDLSSATSGRITFSDGSTIHTDSVLEEDGEFVVRIESGWYNTYERNGRAICSGYIVDHTTGSTRAVVGPDIVGFISEEKIGNNDHGSH
jgi:hypothetical protein